MAPGKSIQKKNIKTNLKTPNNCWVILSKSEVLERESSEQSSENGSPDIVTLRHPKSGRPARYLFSSDNNSVQELVSFVKDKTSWFIDESVKSDGTLYLSTPIDPIFLVLPYIRKHCTSQAIPLEQLLMHEEEYSETGRLLKSSGLKYLTAVCDRKGVEELNAFKYNEEKTLVWLKKKTEKVAELLQRKNIHITEGAVSATYVKSCEVSNITYLKCAHGIVSEYLTEELSDKLLKYLSIPESIESSHGIKRKSLMLSENDAKKVKTEQTQENMVPNKMDVKTPKSAASSKEKARMKAASGSKSISSFFKKT